MEDLSIQEIIEFVKDTVNPKNLRIFQLKDNKGKTVIRTINVFNISLTMHDFVLDTGFINCDDDEIPSLEKYELSIPLDLYKACAVKDKKFILDFEILKRMKELSPELFAEVKPIKWYIKNYPIVDVKEKVKILKNDDN